MRTETEIRLELDNLQRYLSEAKSNGEIFEIECKKMALLWALGQSDDIFN